MEQWLFINWWLLLCCQILVNGTADMWIKQNTPQNECSSLGAGGYQEALTEIFVWSISGLCPVLCLHLHVTSLLPDGFFPLELWRHWFKRVIRWRIWIYFILKGHMIHTLVLRTKGEFQEKPGRTLMSIFSYMIRKQLNIGSVTTLRITSTVGQHVSVTFLGST